MTDVVAAVICRGGRYLLCRRPAAKRHGGLWEFPGGQVRQGETFAAAMRRELIEEIGVQTDAVSAAAASVVDAATGFLIHFLPVEVDGEPQALEHEKLGWFSPLQIQRLHLAPADASFARRLVRDGFD